MVTVADGASIEALHTFGLAVHPLVNVESAPETTWAVVPLTTTWTRLPDGTPFFGAGCAWNPNASPCTVPAPEANPAPDLATVATPTEDRPAYAALVAVRTTGSAPTGWDAPQVARARPGPVSEAVAVQTVEPSRRLIETWVPDSAPTNVPSGSSARSAV